MKTFLTTLKGKIVAGAVTAAIIGVIVIAVLIISRGYRTIAVESLNGKTVIINNQSSVEAYIGQHLKSGDDVTVDVNSDMTLALDSDKYVFAKENTHFWVEALGKKSDTRTSIHLDKGSTLCRIDNKLATTESFDVDTPNATMSVRGTVFRVSVYTEENSDKYTVIDVLEGEVYVQVKMETGQNTEESRLLKAGESATVRSNKDISEFVKSDNEIAEIRYRLYGQNEAKFLGKAIDEGRTLCISKELLYDYVELNEHQFVIKENDSSVYVCTVCGEEIILDEIKKDDTIKEKSDSEDNQQSSNCDDGHIYEIKKMVEATCNTNGEATYECSVCGDRYTEMIKALGHNYIKSEKKATCIEEGYNTQTCSRCGDTITEKIAALGHNYILSHTDATCTDTGFDIQKCDRCGDTKSKNIAALGHNYSTTTTPATCTSNGTDTTTCSRCGDTRSSTIPATGHNYYLASSTASTCTSAGSEVNVCSNCGDSKVNSLPLAEHSWAYIQTPTGGAEMCTVCSTIR